MNLQTSSEASSSPALEMPAPITLLLPIWGSTHIERFLDLVLPTLIAPGNLPALSAEQPVIVKFLTCSADQERLSQASRAFRLQRYAGVEFSIIDDLQAPDCLPVTLTLAYTRGIGEGVVAGQPRSFLLLNGDFALADGALSHAARELRSGARLLLSPSLRVDEDGIRPLMRSCIDETGCLSLSPEKMTSLALNHLHPTVLASQMDQVWLSANHTHQLCWRVDDHTLVAHGFCLFVLGVTTSQRPPAARSFCDYEMGPDVSGGQAPIIMDHSSKFLALEIAPREYEVGLVEFGPPSLDRIAAQMQQWTTAFHRSQGERRLVFAGLGAASPEVIEKLPTSDVIRDLLAKLGAPQPAHNHPNWRGGLGGWLRSRAAIGTRRIPPELDAPDEEQAPPVKTSHVQKARSVVRAVIVGVGARHVWQPYHRLEKRLDVATRAVAARGGAIRAIGAARLQSFSPLDAFRSAPAGELLLVGLDLTNWASTDAFLQQAEASVVPGQKVALVLSKPDGGRITPMDVARIESYAGSYLKTESIAFLDQQLDAMAEKAFGRLAEADLARNPFRLALMLAGLPFWSLVLLAANFRHVLGMPNQARPNIAILSGVVRATGSAA